MTSPPRVVALLSAYNEADIVDQVLANLIAEDVRVYFLDDGSTDGTRQIAEALIGRGVLAVEALREAGSPGEFDWSRILARKQALAQELEADWFIHHDADEFRESPWPGLTLAEGIARVDAAGYNAIDFALFDFWPTSDEPLTGSDVRDALRYYEPPRWFNRVQTKCWKKGPEVLDLIQSGGHDAIFPNRRVYPLRFILRHYPVRGTAHGNRKVFQERLNRFALSERNLGWHRQYDDFLEGQSFVRASATLLPFEPISARANVVTEDAERLDAARHEAETRASALQEDLNRIHSEKAAALAALASANEERDRADSDRAAATAALVLANAELASGLAAAAGDNARMLTELARTREELEHANAVQEVITADRGRLRADLTAVYHSKTWRWSRPVRRLLDRRPGTDQI